MSSLISGVILAITAALLTCLIDAEPKVLDENDVKAIIPEDYVKALPLNQTTKEAVVVKVTINADAIRKLNLQTMEMSLDFKMKTTWSDYRLNRIEPRYAHNVIRGENLWDHFFIPKLDFVNHLQCNSKPGGLQPSFGSWLTYYPNTKSLNMEYEKSCIFECKFDLSDYPFDVQRCSVEVIHTVYFKEKLMLKGFVQSGSYKSGTTIPPEWELSETKVENCTHSRHHIMTVFVPSVLVVILSWISFTLDIEQGPPRVALGLTTLLTLATQFLNAQKGLPPVAYVKALDIWMIACMVSVFLTLMEFAVANYVHRRWKSRKIEEKVIIRVASGSEPKKRVITEDHGKSKMIDRIGGICISSLFTCFVIGFCACFG